LNLHHRPRVVSQKWQCVPDGEQDGQGIGVFLQCLLSI
jgi:hypothetical protein